MKIWSSYAEDVQQHAYTVRSHALGRLLHSSLPETEKAMNIALNIYIYMYCLVRINFVFSLEIIRAKFLAVVHKSPPVL